MTKAAVPRQRRQRGPAVASLTDAETDLLFKMAEASTVIGSQWGRLGVIQAAVDAGARTRGWPCLLDSAACAEATGIVTDAELLQLKCFAVKSTPEVVQDLRQGAARAKQGVDACEKVVKRVPYVPQPRPTTALLKTEGGIRVVREKFNVVKRAFERRVGAAHDDWPLPMASLNAAVASICYAEILVRYNSRDPRIMAMLEDAAPHTEKVVQIAETIVRSGLKRGTRPKLRSTEFILAKKVVAAAARDKAALADLVANGGLTEDAATRQEMMMLVVSTALLKAQNLDALAMSTSRRDVATAFIASAWVLAEALVLADGSLRAAPGRYAIHTPTARLLWRREGSREQTAASVMQRMARFHHARRAAIQGARNAVRFAMWDRDEDCHAAATLIATHMRNQVGMKHARFTREMGKKYEDPEDSTTAAAVTIQSVVRSRLSRLNKLKPRLVARAMMKRERYEAARTARAERYARGGPRYGTFYGYDGVDRETAAVEIQRVARGRAGRARARDVVKGRQSRAATQIQKHARRSAESETLARLRADRLSGAATRIQRLSGAATRIQRIARGRRSRFLVEARRMAVGRKPLSTSPSFVSGARRFISLVMPAPTIGATPPPPPAQMFAQASVVDADGKLVMRTAIVDVPRAGYIQVRDYKVLKDGTVQTVMRDEMAPEAGMEVFRRVVQVRGKFVEVDEIRPALRAGRVKILATRQNEDGTVSVHHVIVDAPPPGHMIVRSVERLPDGTDVIVERVAAPAPLGHVVVRRMVPLAGGQAALVDEVVALGRTDVVLKEAVRMPDGTTGYADRIVERPDPTKHAIVKMAVTNADGSVLVVDRIVAAPKAGMRYARVTVAHPRGKGTVEVDIVEAVVNQTMVQMRKLVVAADGSVRCDTVLVSAQEAGLTEGKVLMRVETCDASGETWYEDVVENAPTEGECILREYAVDADGRATFKERRSVMPGPEFVVVRVQRTGADGKPVVEDRILRAPTGRQVIVRSALTTFAPGADHVYVEKIIEVPAGTIVVRRAHVTLTGQTVYDDEVIDEPPPGVTFVRRPRTDVDGRETYESVQVGGAESKAVPAEPPDGVGVGGGAAVRGGFTEPIVIVRTITVLENGIKTVHNVVDARPGAKPRVDVVGHDGTIVAYKHKYDDLLNFGRLTKMVQAPGSRSSFLDIFQPVDLTIEGVPARRNPVRLARMEGEVEFADAEADAFLAKIERRDRDGAPPPDATCKKSARPTLLTNHVVEELRAAMLPGVGKAKAGADGWRNVWAKAISKQIMRNRAVRMWGTAEAKLLMREGLYKTFNDFDVVTARARRNGKVQMPPRDSKGRMTQQPVRGGNSKLKEQARSRLDAERSAVAQKAALLHFQHPAAALCVLLVQASFRARTARARVLRIREGRAREASDCAAKERNDAATAVQAKYRGHRTQVAYKRARQSALEEAETLLAADAAARAARRHDRRASHALTPTGGSATPVLSREPSDKSLLLTSESSGATAVAPVKKQRTRKTDNSGAAASVAATPAESLAPSALGSPMHLGSREEGSPDTMGGVALLTAEERVQRRRQRSADGGGTSVTRASGSQNCECVACAIGEHELCVTQM